MTSQAAGPRVHLSPSSRLGRWAMGLFGLSILVLVYFLAMIAAGQKGGEGFFDNLLLTVPFLISGSSAVAGLVVGALAIVRSHERGLALVVPILWGLFVLTFALGEVVNPH